MVSIWQSLVLPLVLLGSKTRYVAFIHDGELHDGDQSKLMLLCYWLEFRFAKDIVVMSAAVGAQIRDRVRLDQGLVETVLGSFGRESSTAEALSRRADDKVVVGMFGRLNPYKGLDLFAESMEILRAEGLAVSGAVYGSGGPELEHLVRAHPNISWNIGWIDEDEVNSIVASFDILALPYREASQSGIVALAVAEGVPMVATPVGGLEDQVLASGAGIVAEAVDAIAFSDAVRRLVSNADLRAGLSRAGQEAASSVFSWTRVVADIRPALLGDTKVHE
jgi:glycosyltransferase involved in cell wall biosynthesis